MIWSDPSMSTTLWAPDHSTSIIMRQCKDKGHISHPQEKPQSTSTRGGRGVKTSFFMSNVKQQVSFIPTRPPTTYVNTCFCPQHEYWWCLFTTRHFHISSLGSWFFFGAWGSFAQVLAAASLFFPFDTHMRKPLGQHVSFFQLWNFLVIPPRRVFLGQRNEIRQGLAASHVNSHWLVNPRHIVPEKTQWKWTWGMGQNSCNGRFPWKNQGMWEAVGRESNKSTLNVQ